MQDNKKPLEMPKKKHDRNVISQAKKELKKKSKSELINIIINLSSKIDEMKQERENV